MPVNMVAEMIQIVELDKNDRSKITRGVQQKESPLSVTKRLFLLGHAI
jgi:hypothetical protein